MDQNVPQKPSLLRLPQVMQRSGYKKSKIYKAVAAGTFPAPIKDGRTTSWIEEEVDAWIRALIKRARATPAPQWKKIPRRKKSEATAEAGGS